MIARELQQWLTTLQHEPYFIKHVPLDALVSEIIRRNIGLNEIVAIQMSKMQSQREQDERANRGPMGANGAPNQNNESEFPYGMQTNEKGLIDIKQQTLQLLAKAAYKHRLISKSDFDQILCPQTSSIRQHPKLAYQLACRFPNLYYVSDQSVPFGHYFQREHNLLPSIYSLFLSFQGKDLIEKWTAQWQNFRNLQERRFQQEIQREEELSRQEGDGEEDSIADFIVNDGEQAEEQASSEEQFVEVRQRKPKRPKRIQKSSRKKSKMSLGDQDEDKKNGSPLKKLRTIDVKDQDEQLWNGGTAKKEGQNGNATSEQNNTNNKQEN